jgi:RNA polymerase sigma-70 factor (ECF subfamily)
MYGTQTAQLRHIPDGGPVASAVLRRPRNFASKPSMTSDGPRTVPPDRMALAGYILAIASRGDQQAFAALFAHFAPRVKTYLIRLGTPGAAADDLAQETLLMVWRKAAYFDPSKAGASTWVFTIARNLRIDVLRRERHPEIDADDPMLKPDDAPQPDDNLASTQREQRIRAAMTMLPADQADVVRLSFFEDKPHREIELDLGIPLGTVKSRLRLAMAKLRSVLGEDL